MNVIGDSLYTMLTSPEDFEKSFFDQNTQKNVTYGELLAKCNVNKKTGLTLLPIVTK